MKRFWLTVLIVTLLVSAYGAIVFAQFNEAPMLEALVLEGQLPPVEERLPKNPFVVGPGVLVALDDLDWEVGRYGGTLRTVHVGADFTPDATQGNFLPMLNAPSFHLDQLSGNVVEEFSVNDDATEFTFTIREGLRWSDGHLVTTEDVRFALEDVFSNRDIYPTFPGYLRSGGTAAGEPMELEIIDDLTFRLVSSEPYGSLLTTMALRFNVGVYGFLKPAHYLKQFHIAYTTLDEMRPYLDAEELTDEWWTLFSSKDVGNWDTSRRRSIGFPVLTPWMRVESPAGIIAMERNPYYFKVDTAGNQLPYIDRLESYEVSDLETTVMRVITGEVDYLREAAGLPHMPMYQEHAERAGFIPRLMRRVLAPTSIMINYTNPDPTWQLVVSDLRFRQALSLGIDREEILDSVMFGQGSIPIWVAEEFVNHDPVRAEQLLDEMGMQERDRDGFRLAPNGEPFLIHFEVAPGIAEIVPTTELVTEHLRAIGINATFREIGMPLLSQRGQANEIYASIGWLHPGGWPHIFMDYLPGSWGSGREWQLWHATDGSSGEEPDPWAQTAWDIRDQVLKTRPDAPEMDDLRSQIMEWYHEYLPSVIVMEEIRDPLITSARLGNVAHGGFSIPAYMPVEQMFFRE